MNRKVISSQYSRRKFIHKLSFNAASAVLALNGLTLFSSCNDSNNKEKNKGTTMGEGDQKKLGIALVGLGNYAGGQLAPALQQTQDCYLAGMVTGTPSKIDTWKSKFST